jgi:hypothetical protein
MGQGEDDVKSPKSGIRAGFWRWSFASQNSASPPPAESCGYSAIHGAARAGFLVALAF